jgi:hypothetical protein
MIHGGNTQEFDRDFREGAVRLTRKTGTPIAQLARNLALVGQLHGEREQQQRE